MLSDVQTLAAEIGPRGTGTPGEAAAAAHVAKRLEASGVPVERLACRAVAFQNAFPLAIDAVALLSVGIYPLGGIARWMAAFLGLAAAPLLIYTLLYSTSPLSFLLPRVRSQSIVARLAARGRVTRRVVTLAHLDTNRVRLAWQSGMRRFLAPLTLLTLVMLASLGVLYLIGALLRDPAWVWPLSWVPAAYVLGTVVTLVSEERGPFTCGANDNAASVAVGLALAERLKAEPLERTEVWLAFTGGEETDHAGLRALLRAHASELRLADFIGLEGLGGGQIVYLVQQGLLFHYAPDPGLLSLADEVAARRPELGVGPAEMTMTDEVGTLRRARYRAIGLAGRDPASGALPHWHRLDDTVDTVEPMALQTALAFVWEMLQALDDEAKPCASS